MKTNMYFREEEEVKSRQSSVNKLIVTPGIWVNGQIHWVRNGSEKLISKEEISIRIKERAVHSQIKLFDFFVKNHGCKSRKVKVFFMHQYPQYTENHFTFVSPAEKVIYHITDNLMYLVNGQYNEELIEQMTIQPYWHIHTEHIWSSLKEGILKYQPMAKGMMVSIFSLAMTIPANKTCKGNCWRIFGEEKEEILLLNKVLLKQTSNSN